MELVPSNVGQAAESELKIIAVEKANKRKRVKSEFHNYVYQT